MAKAALGVTVEIPTVHGKKTLDIPCWKSIRRTFHSSKEKVHQIFVAMARGDMVVELQVMTPTNLCEEQKAGTARDFDDLCHSMVSIRKKKDFLKDCLMKF